MANSNKVCRSILDTRDVLNNQLTATLVESLVSSETITQDECKELSTRVSKCVNTLMDGLVDRVLVEFQE